MGKSLKIFSGKSNLKLANGICKNLNIELGKCLIENFSNGETKIQIEESVRGADSFVIQTCAEPVNDNLVEMLLIIDALKRASASRITAIIPLYFYARQDRKDKPRVPISAKLVADMISSAGADRLITMDLHSAQTQGFFNVPVDNIYASPVLLPYLKEKYETGAVIVSPDTGGVPRAKAYASMLKLELAVIDKRREKASAIDFMQVLGDVKGKTAIILDDMADTCGTLVKAAETLIGAGAKDVVACVTHAVLSGNALEKLAGSQISALITTDTLPEKSDPKITSLSTAKIFSEAIRNIHENKSVSGLFEIRY